MARNPFSQYATGVSGPAVGSLAITPNNTDDMTSVIRAITINGAGTVSWVSIDGVTYSTGPLPAGTYPMRATRIRANGTTATGITGWV